MATKPLDIIHVMYSLDLVTIRPGNNTFLHSLRKNDVEAQVEFKLKSSVEG